jgi:hypothetical protein
MWVGFAAADGNRDCAALLVHAGGVLYGMELGSVTLNRIGFFCFPIQVHSTHTVTFLLSPIKHIGVTLKINNQHTVHWHFCSSHANCGK